MGFSTITPPKDEKQLQTTAFEIVFACKMLGVEVDIQRFLLAWSDGLRVLLERDANDKIISFAFLISGTKWYDPTKTATILSMAGNKDKMIEYAKNVCSILGAEYLIYSDGTGEEVEGGMRMNTYRMRI